MITRCPLSTAPCGFRRGATSPDNLSTNSVVRAEELALAANAIIGVGFSTSYIMASAAEILVYGNAATIQEEG